RCQTPAPVRPETPREVLGMVVTIVEEHIEDCSRVGFLHFALVARQETGSPQESGVVGGTGQAKIHLQQSSQTMHRDTLPTFPVEARDAEAASSGPRSNQRLSGTSSPQSRANSA